MPSPDLIVMDDRCGDVALPVNPFVSNRYHFGMLLGVADLEAEQAYHRGKAWLHNAWQHGIGVVWGLRVDVETDRNELLVRPGLAVDGHGRELHVAQELCVDLARWFAERRPDDMDVVDHPDGGVTFTVHVELCHDSCLDRPVPSIAEPCGDVDMDTAYSRSIERGLPRVVAGPAPGEPDPWYPRLRQFFGQLPVADAMVATALAELEAAAVGDRPTVCLGWFRRLAAEDTMALAPAEGAPGWSPVAGDGCVPLAEVAVHLDAAGNLVGGGSDPTEVDNHVRPSHVRTRTIQELLCGAHVEAAHGGGPGAPDVAAPQAVDGSATISGQTISLSFTRPLDPTTVVAAAFTVNVLRADGWNGAEITQAGLEAAGTRVDLRLTGAPRSRPIRIIASGAGPAPLLGTDGRPLSGLSGTPEVPTGADAVLTITPEPEPDPDPDEE